MTSAKIRIDVDDSQLNAKLRQQEQKMKQSFDRMSNSGSALDGMVNRVKGSLSAMVPVASLASAGVIIKQIGTIAHDFSRDFSASMREVETISKAVQKDFKGISDEVVSMAANGPEDAISLAKAYYQIVSAGHDGAKGLELLRVSSKAATAGITDTKTAADGLTTILNAWSMDASKAEKVADAMFTTVRLGKTTFGELSSQIAQVAPLAASMEIPFEQILSAVATLTVQGTPTAQAVTQIRSSLVNLNKVLPEGWQKMYTYQEALQKVYNMANGSQNELRKLIPDIEGINAVLGLSGEKTETAARHLKEYATATGEMVTAYDKMMKEAENQWSQVHNKWMRELKAIGDLLNNGSIDLARMLNNLLTNREEDVIKPEVTNAIKNFAGELDSLGDKEAKLKLITDRLIEMKNKAAELGTQEAALQKKQPGSIQKGVEAFNAGIGLGTAFTPGRVNQVELEIVQEDIEINKRVQQELAKLYQKLLTGDEKLEKDNTEKTNKKAKTVADAYTKIKELTDQLGTGTIEQEIQIIAKIGNEQAFIDDFNKKVREKIAENITREINGVVSKGMNLTDSYGLNLKIKPIPVPKADPKKLMVVTEKQLTEEQKKQLDLQKKQEEVEIRLYKNQQQRAKINKEISKGYEDASEVLGAVSFAIGEVDQELGQAIGKMADLASNASTLFANLSTGNFIGAVTSGIGVIGNIFSMFKTEDTNSVETRLENINRTLERQSFILENMKEGESYYGLVNKQLAEYNSLLDENTKKLRSQSTIRLSDSGKQKFGGYAYDPSNPNERFVNTAEFTTDQIIDYWAKGYFVVSEYHEEAIGDILAVQAQINNLLEETWNKATGTTRDSVADSIIEGFKQGYDSAADFADTFEELMKTAIINSFKTQLIEGELTEWYKGFAEAGKDGYTDKEIEYWKGEWEKLIESNNVKWDNIEKITGVNPNDTSNGNKQTGMTGAIQGITEETAGLIAGQFTAMRIDLKTLNTNIADLIGDQFLNMDRAMSSLERIQENTSHTKRLNDVCNLLETTNQLLKSGLL